MDCDRNAGGRDVWSVKGVQGPWRSAGRVSTQELHDGLWVNRTIGHVPSLDVNILIRNKGVTRSCFVYVYVIELVYHG